MDHSEKKFDLDASSLNKSLALFCDKLARRKEDAKHRMRKLLSSSSVSRDMHQAQCYTNIDAIVEQFFAKLTDDARRLLTMAPPLPQNSCSPPPVISPLREDAFQDTMTLISIDDIKPFCPNEEYQLQQGQDGYNTMDCFSNKLFQNTTLEKSKQANRSESNYEAN